MHLIVRHSDRGWDGEKNGSQEESGGQSAQAAAGSLEQQLKQRNAELAIINAIQHGLASKMGMQSIYNLVGDKVRDIAQLNARIQELENANLA